jgi:hypothetical protein
VPRDHLYLVFDRELREAVRRLPSDVAMWMSRAFRSGWFRMAAGAYEGGGGGESVCPITAAARMAGAWLDGGIADGHEAWGTPDGPSPEVEDFAAYFDLCAEEAGLDRAIGIVLVTLAENAATSERAA